MPEGLNMLNQEQRLQDFKANATQVEMEANQRLYAEAVSLLKKGYTPRFVANKTFTAYKKVCELKEQLGL